MRNFMDTVIVGMFLFAVPAVAQDDFSYRCSLDGTILTFQIVSSDYLMTAYKPDSGDMACPSSEDAVSGTNILDIDVDTETEAQTDPAEDCFVIHDSGTTLYTFNIAYTNEQNGLYTDLARYFDLTCDAANAGSQATNVNLNAPISGTGVPLSGVQLEPEDYTMVCTLADDAGELPATLELGEMIKIVCVFTHPPLTTASALAAQSVRITEVNVYGNSDTPAGDQLPMQDAQGCPSIGPGGGFHLPDSFTRIYTDAKTVTLSSSMFPVARFPYSLSIYINIFFVICLNRDPLDPCNITPVCQGNERKRRSADVVPSNGTFIVERQISLIPFPSTQKAPKSAAPCDNSLNNIWIVSLVIGVLLLVVLALAVFLFFRLLRERKANGKFDHQGIQNPVYG